MGASQAPDVGSIPITRLSSSRFLGIAIAIGACGFLFFWGYDSYEVLYHFDNVNLARQLIPYAQHTALDFEARRVLGPSYGALLALLAWILPNPQSAIAAFSFMTAAGVLFMIYFTARRLYSEAAAWFALVCAAATPGFILYVRWGFAYLLFSMAVSLVLMQGAWAWKNERKYWAIWVGVGASGIGLVSGLFSWPANNLVLLPLALIGALVVLNARVSPKDLTRPVLLAAGLIIIGVALIAALSGWHGFESPWSEITEVVGHLGRRQAAFRGHFSWRYVAVRFWAWAMEFFFKSGAYYNVFPYFDWAACPQMPPAFSLLGLAGLFLSTARRQDSGKILLAFFLIPLAEICALLDYLPRYTCVFWPVFWIAGGYAASELWVNFRPARLRSVARIFLSVILAVALAESALRVFQSINDNRAPANVRWPLASGVLSNKPRFLPAWKPIVGSLVWRDIFSMKVTYASQAGIENHNDVVAARFAAEAAVWISRRRGSLIALGGESLLPFNLLTNGAYAQAAAPIQRILEDSSIGEEAFVFANFNNPYNDELQRLELPWPPDPSIFKILPIPALRLNLAKARRIVVPRRWAAHLWPQIRHKPTKQLEANALLSDSLIPGQKTEGAFTLEIVEPGDYRIWCLIKPPDPPGSMAFSLDKGAFVDGYRGSMPEEISVYWALIARRRLVAGDHEIYAECRGPGRCLWDRCVAVPN